MAVRRVVCERKALKGLIRVSLTIVGDVIEEAKITGDFFLYPEDALWLLEEKLKGVRADVDSIRRVLEETFRDLNITTAGCSVEDFVLAMKCALEGV